MALVSSGNTVISLNNGRHAIGPLDLYKSKKLSIVGDMDDDPAAAVESIIRMTTSGDRRPCAVVRDDRIE
jgi:hypothetical protein